MSGLQDPEIPNDKFSANSCWNKTMGRQAAQTSSSLEESNSQEDRTTSDGWNSQRIQSASKQVEAIYNEAVLKDKGIKNGVLRVLQNHIQNNSKNFQAMLHSLWHYEI
jgi:hypothetical protein